MKDKKTIPPFPFTEEGEDIPISHLIRIVEHSFGHTVRENLEKSGIPRAFGPVLTELSRYEGLSQGELADKMFFKPSSISVTIQKMEEMGYIRREQHENDARQVRIFLTDDGKLLADKIRKTFLQVEKDILDVLTTEELSELRRILEKLKASRK
ncbi:MAG: hypothetical protein DBX47_00830 [Clostridiales bacterium]|nr:MAG: hypothetical protein DBX47_00830 [Clostridiales bacterium]